MQRYSEYGPHAREVGYSHGLKEWYQETTHRWLPHTELYDTIRNCDTGEIQSIHTGQPNLIVQGFGILVATLLADASTSSGILYWAVGEGEGASWDSLTSEQRQAKSTFDLTDLYDEISRVTCTVVFLDPNNIEVEGPTNKIEVRAIFGPTTAGNLREFGLFGGASATATLGSGLMIDHKAHTVINLNQDSGQAQVLVRALRITL